jgi:hypothetical protein
MGPAGVRTVGLVVSTVRKWARSEAEVLLGMLRQARDRGRHGQLLSGNDIRAANAATGTYLGVGADGRPRWRYLPS